MKNDLKELIQELKDVVNRLECAVYSDVSQYTLSSEKYKEIVHYLELDDDDGYPD